LDAKKLNSKSTIARKLQISLHVVTSSRRVCMNLNFHFSQQRTFNQFIAGAKVFNFASLLRDYRKGHTLKLEARY